MPENIFTIHHQDARTIDSTIKKKIVDVTITSPPYFDMKDYGSKNQIGFGQSYEEYLIDLKEVFRKVFVSTKDSGSLWVILDTFKKGEEIIPLPFDFSNKLREIGWKLKEIIIWRKDRTVPWTHRGQMRNSFEYILLFTKSNEFTFQIDKIREIDTLKKWWVKYPERYNPQGKTPIDIWEFSIPIQGSWGSGYIRHFCPLPEKMIARIISLTTKEGNVVLDPFAGSGSVLVSANKMKRKYIGFELNANFIKMFKKYLSETQLLKKEKYKKNKLLEIDQKIFSQLILDLRKLKFARLLISKLKSDKNIIVQRIYVPDKNSNSKSKNKLVTSKFIMLIRNKNKKLILNAISTVISEPPLSKFGIDGIFAICNDVEEFKKNIKCSYAFTYNQNNTHKYYRKIKVDHLEKLDIKEKIISKLKIQLSESDYD